MAPSDLTERILRAMADHARRRVEFANVVYLGRQEVAELVINANRIAHLLVRRIASNKRMEVHGLLVFEVDALHHLRVDYAGPVCGICNADHGQPAELSCKECGGFGFLHSPLDS